MKSKLPREGRNFHQKYPPVNKLTRMLATEKDCGDRLCFLTFKVVENCVIYTKSEVHPLCNVPCDTRDCAVEIVHNVMCPTWFCTQKPTTPLPPTPAPSPSVCSTPACIAAASTSGLFAILALVFLLLIWKKSSLANRLRARLSLYERIDEESTPIFRPQTTRGGRDDVRVSWSAVNPNAVGFSDIPLNDPGEAETRF